MGYIRLQIGQYESSICECRNDFTTYAEVCFQEFGDRVPYWTTVNEPDVFAVGGYDGGITPPRHCSPPFGVNCTRGNSSSEPYIAVHNILLAHASAARLYKKKYQVIISKLSKSLSSSTLFLF